MSARIRRKSLSAIAREGFLDRRSKRCFWLLLSPQTKVARAGARNYPRRRQIMRLRRCGGELAFPWRGGGLRRPHFFLRRKKCGKESRLDLRSNGPLARGGQVQIWRCVLAGGVQRSSLSVKRTVPAFTGAEAGAAACPATVGVFASTGLAIIKSRLCRLAAAKVGVPVGHGV